MTARKKTIKHKLIYVLNGYVSTRIGKEEFLISEQQAFWLPLDCLTALTYFPNTTVLEIEVSARSLSHYAHQAGFIEPSSLTLALLERLSKVPFQQTDIQQQTWLKALNFELEVFKPQLITGKNTLKLASLNIADSASFQMVIKVREALKARSSGMPRQKVIDDFFAGSETNANHLCNAITNANLT